MRRRTKRVSATQLRFVDPETWDGNGEIVVDEAVVAEMRQVYSDIALVLDDDAITEHERRRLRAEHERYSPSETRTQLVRVRVELR